MSRDLKNAQRWVIKIGSSLLTNNGQGLDLPAIEAWVKQLLVLRRHGLDIVLVSSGAVAAAWSAWAGRAVPAPCTSCRRQPASARQH
jgi:Glutamate 5-kinase